MSPRMIWLTLSLVACASVVADDTISRQRQQELRDFLKQDCGSCHGLTMRGGLGPALLPQSLSGKSPDVLAATILNGRPGTAMPPWSPLLSDQEARWLAEMLLRGLE